MLKLHLGCGNRFIPGYVHVDVAAFPHIQICHAIDRLPMIAEGTVDVIYACHVLEHFMRADTVRVLHEWNRLLRVGGTLRVAVPDFAALARLYTQGSPLGALIGPLVGRQDGLYNFHYNVFDFDSLHACLTSAGFVAVRRYVWQETDHAEIDDFSRAYIPHLDFEHGTLISLNVEATKA